MTRRVLSVSGVFAALLVLADPIVAEDAAAPAAVVPSSDWETVTIGVRPDARPFAWRDMRPHTDGEDPGPAVAAAADREAPAPTHTIFRGFLVELCKAAAIHARFRPELVEVTAEQRRDFLSSLEPDVGAGEPEDPGFDVLCDPTTLSLSRMYRLSVDERFVFSPILFVANSSFVRPDPVALKDAEAAGRWPIRDEITDGDAAAGVEALRAGDRAAWLKEQGEPDRCIRGKQPDGRAITAGYVVGTTAEDAIRAAVNLEKLPAAKEYCPVAFRSHRDGMEGICKGAIDFYFGDIDIISEYEKEIGEAPDKFCKLNYTRDFLIYEPYALLVGKGKNDFRPKFMRELYRLFSDDTVEKEFAAHFPSRRASAALMTLFQINGVPMGTLRAPPRPAEPIDGSSGPAGGAPDDAAPPPPAEAPATVGGLAAATDSAGPRRRNGD